MTSPIEDIKEQVLDIKLAKEYGEELAKINVAVTMAEARVEKGLTQEQLAVMAGTSQPYIAKLESGDANPSVGAVGKILAVLGFRFVPGKDSLVSETRLPYQLNPLLIGTEVYTTAIDFTPAFGLSALNQRIIWQNPNQPGNRIPSIVAYKTVGGTDIFTGEINKGITANSENMALAGN